jgi:uncharacterized protein (TIGR02145 family)
MGWGLNQYRLVRIYMRRPCKGYYLRWYYNGWHYWFFLPGKSLVLTEGERYRTLGTKKVSMGSGQITSFQIDAIRTILNSKEVAMYTNAGWMAIRIEQTPAIVRTNQIAGYEMDFTAIIGSKEISYITGFSPILNIPTVIPPVIGQCEITIGTQVWMCKNFEGEYPGSKVYNNNELSRTVYGGLYTLSQINNPGFCPSGWHVPTLADWNELINFLGGAAVAGAKLKETGLAYWEYEAADNSSGFAARGSGMYWMGVFSNLSIYGNLWYNGGIISIQANLTAVQVIPITTLVDYFIAVRLIKDSTPLPPVVHFDDWFLPSKDELNLMYVNLHLFGVGGFAGEDYWSSSEYLTSAGDAWTQYFWDGSVSYFTKFNTARVRACRVFISSTVYTLRDIGEAGGLIFYIVNNGDGTYTYYEAAPADVSISNNWSDIDDQYAGTGTAIGTGQTNTNLIVAQVIGVGGWFLPSQEELNGMRDELHLHSVGGFQTDNVPYWSSSQENGILVRNLNFLDGVLMEGTKNGPFHVRACRTFTSNVVYALRDTGPAGGLIFHIINNGGGSFTYYETAPADQSDSIWSNVPDLLIGTNIAMGMGASNTALIINQPGHVDSAAKVCTDLDVGGTTVDSAAKLCDDLIT